MGAFTSGICAYSSRLSAEPLGEAFDLGSAFSTLGDNIKSMATIRMKAGKDPNYAAILNNEVPPRQKLSDYSRRKYFYIGNTKDVQTACESLASGSGCPVEKTLRNGFAFYIGQVKYDGNVATNTDRTKLRTDPRWNKLTSIGGTDPRVGLAKCIVGILKSGKTYFTVDDLISQEQEVYKEFIENPDVLSVIQEQFDAIWGITVGLDPNKIINDNPYMCDKIKLPQYMFEIANSIPVKDGTLGGRLNGLDVEDKDYATAFAKQKKFAQSGKGGGSGFFSQMLQGAKKAMQTGASAWDAQMARRPRVG